MLEELVVELDGRRFIGHLYDGELSLAGPAPRRWRFSCCGCVAAEFPSTDLDTPEQVRTRLEGVLRRTERHVLDRQSTSLGDAPLPLQDASVLPMPSTGGRAGLPDPTRSVLVTAPKADPAVVLVVDDEPPVLHIMERALTEAGFHVHGASHPIRALALVTQGALSPDVLVTDLRMKELNGAELARLITARHPNTRVLLVSGYDADRAEAPWPFLRKPFSIEDLVNGVKQVVAVPSSPPARRLTG